jgi:hypothetical protein
MPGKTSGGRHHQEGVLQRFGDAGLPVVGGPHLLFPPPALGQVAHDLAEPAQSALLVAQRRDDAAAPEAGAVLAQVPPLVLGAPLGRRRRKFALGLAVLAVFGHVDDVSVPADDLGLGPAQDALRPRVPGDDAAPRVGEEDRVVRDRLHQQAELFLGAGEGWRRRRVRHAGGVAQNRTPAAAAAAVSGIDWSSVRRATAAAVIAPIVPVARTQQHARSITGARSGKRIVRAPVILRDGDDPFRAPPVLEKTFNASRHFSNRSSQERRGFGRAG